MKLRPDLFFPPGIIIEDKSVIYRRKLQEARRRQEERDLEAEAHIDNAFYGQPYLSIFDEYPDLKKP